MMSDADMSKMQALCAITLNEYSGIFKRRTNGNETEEDLHRVVSVWLEKERVPERVERMINHLHVYDEFPDLTENAYDDIAVQIFSHWNEFLKKIDPAFRVEKYEEYGPTITFYKKRGPNT